MGQSQHSSEAPYNGSKVLSGARLFEFVVMLIISSIVSGILASMITVNVLEERIYGLDRELDQHVIELQEELQETKQELQRFREDFYRPIWPPDSALNITFNNFRDHLKRSLHTAGQRFTGTDTEPDDDWIRFTLAATADLATRRGLTREGSAQLVAGTVSYPAPSDLIGIKSALWGRGHGISLWDDRHPGRLPRPRILRSGANVTLELSPAPTLMQIHSLGTEYRYYYSANYWTGSVNDDLVLDRVDDRDLLLLRAQAEAMRELSFSNVVKPGETKIRLAQSRNLTSNEMFEALMAEYERRAGMAR